MRVVFHNPINKLRAMVSSARSKKARVPLEQMIVNAILRHAQPAKIILFGSRARAEAHERSDYDVVIADEHLTRAALAHLRAEIAELPTLLNIDIVWLNRAATILRERILSEGKILYEPQD